METKFISSKCVENNTETNNSDNRLPEFIGVTEYLFMDKFYTACKKYVRDIDNLKNFKSANTEAIKENDANDIIGAVKHQIKLNLFKDIATAFNNSLIPKLEEMIGHELSFEEIQEIFNEILRIHDSKNKS